MPELISLFGIQDISSMHNLMILIDSNKVKQFCECCVIE